MARKITFAALLASSKHAHDCKLPALARALLDEAPIQHRPHRAGAKPGARRQPGSDRWHQDPRVVLRRWHSRNSFASRSFTGKKKAPRNATGGANRRSWDYERVLAALMCVLFNGVNANDEGAKLTRARKKYLPAVISLVGDSPVRGSHTSCGATVIPLAGLIRDLCLPSIGRGRWAVA